MVVHGVGPDAKAPLRCIGPKDVQYA
jgi:hypothetical protein